MGDAPRATHGSTWSSGARTASEETSRSQRAPSPFRALPPHRDRQRFQLAPTWPPAAAGSRATSQPSGLSLPLTPRPCRSRAARAKAPWRRGAAASHWRPLPWRRKGNATRSDLETKARSRHATAGSSRRAVAHFRWGELESVTRPWPGMCRAHAHLAAARCGDRPQVASHRGAAGAGIERRG